MKKGFNELFHEYRMNGGEENYNLLYNQATKITMACYMNLLTKFETWCVPYDEGFSIVYECLENALKEFENTKDTKPVTFYYKIVKNALLNIQRGYMIENKYLFGISFDETKNDKDGNTLTSPLDKYINVYDNYEILDKGLYETIHNLKCNDFIKLWIELIARGWKVKDIATELNVKPNKIQVSKNNFSKTKEGQIFKKYLKKYNSI